MGTVDAHKKAGLFYGGDTQLPKDKLLLKVYALWRA